MILCIGEILVDMIGSHKDNQMVYTRYAGGAPFNVACGIANYKGKAAFLGTVGDDIPGHFLYEYAKKKGLVETLINIDKERNTTLAFVENDLYGERTFSFYRKNTADYFIKTPSIECMKNYDIIHIGSLMLSKENGKRAFEDMLTLAKKLNKKISFDINFRSDIFDNEQIAIETYKKYIEYADILKFSEEELYLFTGLNEIKEAVKEIAKPHQIIFVTLGKKGALCFYENQIYQQDSIKVNPVDTTGCGDAFYAAILKCLDETNQINADFINYALKFANISGALVATKKGAIDSLPTLEEIYDYIK